MTQLSGRILYPGDPGWDDARHGFAAWADYAANTPRAVVFCQNAQDVAHAVRWANENKVPVRSRCGRHNYEGYSSLVADGLIIDVSEMGSVHVSRDAATAVVGAGLDMLTLFEALGESGLTVPGATGPTVGIAGLTLGGGFGVTTRKWGLTCDNLVDVELVDARGEIIHANMRDNPDLFWALRGGGGGNFGVVTAFTFTVHKIANVAVFTLTWPWQAFEAIVGAWQDWAPSAEDGLVGTLMLTATQTITLYGQYTADDGDLPGVHALLAPMIAAASPLSVSVQIAPNLAATRITLGVDPANPEWRLVAHSDNQIFKSTSAFLFEALPTDAIVLLKTSLETAPALSCAPSQPSMIQLLPGGGCVSRVPVESTAVWARATRAIIQYDAYWTAPEDGAKTIDWIEDVRTRMRPYTRGAYVNYIDDRITDWLREYYGPHLERLVAVKKRYDPGDVFRFPRSIPPNL